MSALAALVKSRFLPAAASLPFWTPPAPQDNVKTSESRAIIAQSSVGRAGDTQSIPSGQLKQRLRDGAIFPGAINRRMRIGSPGVESEVGDLLWGRARGAGRPRLLESSHGSPGPLLTTDRRNEQH